MGCCLNFLSSVYSRQQWRTLVVIALCNFCNCSVTSLLAPLYPPLAMMKGLHPTHIGYIFSASSFSAMCCSFLCGKYISIVGTKLIFDMSMFIMATADIAFGFLMYIDDKTLFFVTSLALRVLSSVGLGGLLTARNAIIANEFPDNTGYTFAILEICIGLGLMTGPTLGAALMEFGGFIQPFIVLGILEIFAAIISVVLLVKHKVVHGERSNSNFITLLLNPKIIFFSLGVLAASLSRGFYEVALENHLQLLGLTPVLVGSLFMLRGGAFTLSSPILGYLCDNLISPMYIVLISALCGSIGFLLLGPAPFIPFESTVTLCIIALFLLGVTGCGELVGGYTGSIRAALDDGFSDNIVTYGLVSAIWSTAYYLGDFLGPITTGAMVEYFGFGWSSTVIFSLHSLVFFTIICYIYYKYSCGMAVGNELYPSMIDETVNDHVGNIENYDAGSLQLFV